MPVLLARHLIDMKLNIVTSEPEKVFSILSEMYPGSIIIHTPILPQIQEFEITENGEPKVYSLEGLLDLSRSYGIPIHDIRIY